MKGYMSARETSYKWGVSESRVHKLCQAGRIPGVTRFGRSWVIPADAKKPTDPRKKHTDSERAQSDTYSQHENVYFPFDNNPPEVDSVENCKESALIGPATDKVLPRQKRTIRSNPYLMLVNAQHRMDPCKAGELELRSYEDIEGIPIQIEKKTLTAYLKLKQYLSECGISVGICSAFRSVDEQQTLWEAGMQKSDFNIDEFTKRVALPGASEHHTGLAIDILLKEGNEWPESLSDPAQEADIFSVIHRVCPRFGFILRYPQGKEAVTGYQYEPWHLRYVGIKHAVAMYKSDLTLEEYEMKEKTP